MEQLLSTKLYIPSTRPELVPRPRLVEKLNQGLHRKLTLISAPAGFGKTTLVSEWVSQSDIPVAWLSLDGGDNDPTRFLSYFAAALNTIEEDIAETALAILLSPQPTPIITVLTEIINRVASFGQIFILVLDDYHVIEAQEVHDALTFLLDHLPPQMHLVITSRSDPLLPIPNLRAKGQVSELRAENLRFTTQEATRFLNQVMGLELSKDSILSLETRTEGWIAGLHLAALSMQDKEDVDRFISEFTGDDRYIVDYLVDEVLAQRPKGTKDFLLRTSILDCLTGSLCNTVTGQENGQEMLERLDQANLFILPLDNRRCWYRYHHLFADVLRQRLTETANSHQINVLHQRASQWYEENDSIEGAVVHALAAKDFERAARFLEGFGPEMMIQSEFDQLEEWLDAMPEEVVRNWPWLCIIRAWMYDRWAQFDIGERYLQYAESALAINTSSISGEADKIIRGQIAAIRALFAIKKGQIPLSLEYSNQALNYLPEGYFNRGMASYTLGWAKCVQGDLPGAFQDFQEGRRNSLVAGNLILAQIITLDIGITYILQGHLHRAAETLQEAIQFKYDKSEIKTPFAGKALVILADILREWNDLDSATSYIEEGVQICSSAKLMDVVAVGYASLAQVYLAQGDMDNAIQMSEKAERMVRDIPDLEPDTKVKSINSHAWLLIAQNKFTDAENYVQERGLSADIEVNYFSEFRQIIYARVLIHHSRESLSAEKLRVAHNTLVKILDLAKPAGYKSQMIEALTLQALAYDAQGENNEAMKSLEEALNLAEPEDYVRIFVDEGEPMQTLLREAESQGIAPNYVPNLLAAFETDHIQVKPLSVLSLIEPLSERELEVLRLLKTELSGPEIANELVIALSTLRTHTQNIYSKLGVSNRWAAVRKAEELNLR